MGRAIPGTICADAPAAVLYSALGCDVDLAPVRDLGLKLDDEGYVVTDPCQQTSVAGIDAVGEVFSDINQISVAIGQAAVAAVRIYNVLDDET